MKKQKTKMWKLLFVGDISNVKYWILNERKKKEYFKKKKKRKRAKSSKIEIKKKGKGRCF